jgi:hypothetical protein
VRVSPLPPEVVAPGHRRPNFADLILSTLLANGCRDRLGGTAFTGEGPI